MTSFNPGQRVLTLAELAASCHEPVVLREATDIEVGPDAEPALLIPGIVAQFEHLNADFAKLTTQDSMKDREIIELKGIINLQKAEREKVLGSLRSCQFIVDSLMKRNVELATQKKKLSACQAATEDRLIEADSKLWYAMGQVTGVSNQLKMAQNERDKFFNQAKKVEASAAFYRQRLAVERGDTINRSRRSYRPPKQIKSPTGFPEGYLDALALS